MPMLNGETVGDMIVRTRRETMAADPASVPEISRRFTPRSIRFQRWPLSDRELASLAGGE